MLRFPFVIMLIEATLSWCIYKIFKNERKICENIKFEETKTVNILGIEKKVFVDKTDRARVLFSKNEIIHWPETLSHVLRDRRQSSNCITSSLCTHTSIVSDRVSPRCLIYYVAIQNWFSLASSRMKWIIENSSKL